jgi:hypothetical protein
MFMQVLGSSGASCAGGGGGNLTGTLEVVSIDATSITVRLSDVSLPGGGSAGVDGNYDAPFCE